MIYNNSHNYQYFDSSQFRTSVKKLFTTERTGDTGARRFRGSLPNDNKQASVNQLYWYHLFTTLTRLLARKYSLVATSSSGI